MIVLLFAWTGLGLADVSDSALADMSVNGLRNRGREQLREQRIAEAVASFRLASERVPWDADARGDLDAIRAWLGTTPAPRSIRDRLGPLEVWSIAILAGACLAFGELRYRGTGRIRWRGVVLGGVLIWLILIAFTYPRSDEPFAVVKVQRVVLRAGNSELYEPVPDGTLPEGSEVTIRGQRGGWIRVQTMTGRTGWIAENELLMAGTMPSPVNSDSR